MSVPRAELDRRVHVFSNALRESGFRLTHQRLEVVREVAGSDEHPDVETIYRGVAARVPTVSLDTVYRTLATLAGLGLIARVSSLPGPARYDANMARHHHFLCTRCGAVRDVVGCDVNSSWAPEAMAGPGTVESVDIQLRGICWECARKGNDRE
jgi:Fur family transcriptional regulator, peroxide stress response regulator